MGWRAPALFVLALVVLAAVSPLRGVLGFPTFYLAFLATVFFWAAQATSWNILSGYSGYFSFGQGAFFGVGAYTTAVLAGRHGVDFFLTIPLAAALSTALALAIGGLAFRLRSLRGEIFALLTLAVPFILAALARFNTAIDGGQGIVVTVPSFPDFIGGFQDLAYLMSLALAWFAVATAFAMQRSRLGWALFSIRDAEDVAEGLGVPTFRYKMIAIALTGMIAGAAGSVFALQVGFVTIENVFGLTVPLFVIVMSVLGGRFHWIGPAAGALIIVTLRDWLTAQGFEGWNLVILGTILAVLVLAAPDGVVARVALRPLRVAGTFGIVLLVLVGLTFAAVEPFSGLEPVDWLAGAMAAAAVISFWPVRARAGRHPVLDVPIGPPVEAPAEPIEAASLPPPPEPARATGAIVECRDVAKQFGGVRALRGVSLAVHEGELLGLVGPNGSGKTTLVNLLSGALRPTAGSIQIDGQEIADLSPHAISHLGVGRTYQIPRPFASMSILDNVAVAIMFGRDTLSLAAARVAALEHLELVGLASRAAARPAEVNLHERQLLEMARAIATRPRVLLLDEAMAGLNPAEIDHAAEVVRRIHASGIAIVLVEHLLRVVNQLATRIVVFDHGSILAQGEPGAVMRDPEVVRAYLGRHAHA
jgi:branched-chain amino acid transport system permease protein